MHHKALDILSTFTDPEFESFGKFLNSPFFNTGKKILQLYKFLYNKRDSNVLSNLKDSEVSKRIFPDIEYNKSTFNALFSDLHSLLSKFLVIQNLSRKDLVAEDFLREELFKRGLYSSVSNSIERSRRLFNNKCPDSEYFINLFNLANDEANFMYLSSALKNKKEISEDLDMIAQRGLQLCCLFTSEMIRVSENISSRGVTYDTGESGMFAGRISALADLAGLTDLIISTCKDNKSVTYFRILKAQLIAFRDFDDESKYFKYKREVGRNDNLLSMNDLRFHYGRMMKYCMMKRKSSLSSQRFDNELLDIYRTILVKGYYKSQITQHLPAELYRNILMHMLRLGKYARAQRFIREFSHELEPGRRENLKRYALARYSFERRQFKKALKMIQMIKADNFIFKLDIRNLTMMIHFELNHQDTVSHLLSSYSEFLSSLSGLSKPAVSSYKAFAKAVKNLLALKDNKNSSSDYRIAKILEGHFPNRDWVEKKYYAIKGS